MENFLLKLGSCEVAVRTDDLGRFCINDLHEASGGDDRTRPNYFLSLKQTRSLVAEIEKAGIPAINARQRLGTFVSKELVYAYAMWIRPDFYLNVIRAFDALVQGNYAEATYRVSEYVTRLGMPFRYYELGQLGKLCRLICDREGVTPNTFETPQNGKVVTEYPVRILKEALAFSGFAKNRPLTKCQALEAKTAEVLRTASRGVA